MITTAAEYEKYLSQIYDVNPPTLAVLLPSSEPIYKIDLNKERMHWWAFNELIEGLTDESILYKIRELRNFDLSDIKDTRTKTKIRDAQRQVALINKENVVKNKRLDEYWKNALKKR